MTFLLAPALTAAPAGRANPIENAIAPTSDQKRHPENLILHPPYICAKNVRSHRLDFPTPLSIGTQLSSSRRARRLPCLVARLSSLKSLLNYYVEVLVRQIGRRRDLPLHARTAHR